MPCPRLCIDDMCHGCREDTLCGGSYCYYCDHLTSGDSTCDDCRDFNEDYEIDAEPRRAAPPEHPASQLKEKSDEAK